MRYWTAYWWERFLNAIRWRGYPAPWSAVIKYRWAVWQARRDHHAAKEQHPYVSAYDRKQSEVRAARMGGNSPQAWGGK